MAASTKTARVKALLEPISLLLTYHISLQQFGKSLFEQTLAFQHDFFKFVLGNAIPNFLEHDKIGRRKRGTSDRATTLVTCFASVV